MPSLYLLTEIYTELLGLLDECQTPEEAAVIIEQIAQVNESIGDKAEAYARIIQSKQREADGYEAEIKRMQARKKTAENLIERLREQLLIAMEEAGASKIDRRAMLKAHRETGEIFPGVEFIQTARVEFR